MNDSTRLIFCSFLFLFLSISFTQAATITAIADGPWEKDIWSSPAGPQPGDSIVIPLERTVHLNTFVDLSTVDNDTETKVVVYGKLFFYNRTFECGACDEVAIKLDQSSYIFIDQVDGLEEFDLSENDKQNIYFNGAPASFSLPFGPGIINAGDAGLPVELAAFSGTAETRVNKLSWITVSEEQTSHFEIEASSNAYDAFVRVGTQAAQGNSNTLVNYSFEDVNSNAKTYYRLKMVDFDGTFEYSHVIIVERAVEAFEVSVYPNPVIEDMNIQVDVKHAGLVQIQIFNTIGGLVETGKYELSTGQHTLSYQLGANQSTYYVQVIQGNQSNTQKVLANKMR